MLEAIDLLEDCYYLDVTVGDVPLKRYACQLAGRLGVADADEHGLAAERHQIAFCAQLPADDREDVMQRVVYRADLPYREEFSAISYPAELNRRPGSSVAVGPYVSVVCGQQDYVENGAFISAAQAVASAVRLREIRDLAYHDVRLFREAQSASQSVHTRRHTLERMANQLGNLELELSFSVESSADLGLLVPSLRVAGYHDALYQCMGLRDKADVVGRMLQRLEHSIGAEMTAIESMDRRADDDRRMRWAVALGFLSTVATRDPGADLLRHQRPRGVLAGRTLVDHILNCSNWRRHHQATARAVHYPPTTRHTELSNSRCRTNLGHR